MAENEGVYALDGDTLKLCYSAGLFTLKRKK
jgi:hypothetical protein